MEYTKSEIREQKKRIKHELKKIEDWLPYTENNWMSWVMITSALEALKRVLSPLKTHIIDNDDFNVAVDINNMLVPVWDVYFDKVNSKELEAHSATWDVYDIIKDLRDWIGEYEEEHPKQKTKKSSPKTKVSHDYFKCTINQEKACRIFKRLKGQYIDESTEINDWLLACGFQSNDKTPFKPIKWLAQLNELVYLIDMLFSSCRWRWKAAEHCFTIDSNPPDNGAMRTESSVPTITKEKVLKLDKIF